jgi:hypothetical protein
MAGQEVNDAQLTARAQDPRGLPQSAVPAIVVRDVVEHQIAHDGIERAGIKGQVAGVRVDEFHSVADPFELRVPFGGGPAVA